jgi:formate hydrogenlyase transcriptional activator
MTRLMDWDWPGNIRELQNVIERAVILSPGPSLDVPESAFQSKAAAAPAPISRSPGTFQDGEREIILRALREANGIVGGAQGAAAKLGLKRTTLGAKMKKLGIARPTY